MRFYGLYFHSIILKSMFGRRKKVRTLVMTISTAEHRTYIILSYAIYHIQVFYFLCDTLYASWSGYVFFFLCLMRAWTSYMSKQSVESVDIVEMNKRANDCLLIGIPTE